MSGILRLESLTKGNTLKQGDKTPLKYRLFDADGEKLNIAGKSAKVRFVYPDFLTIGYEKGGLIVAQDDTVTFTIDSVIPSRIYHVEIIVDNNFVFPSRSVESKFTIDKSSLGADAKIIEIVGKDVLIQEVKSQVDTELQPLVNSLESAQQAETQRASEESSRASAEAQRKTDHANRSAELDGKADKVVIKNLIENGDFSINEISSNFIISTSVHESATINDGKLVLKPKVIAWNNSIQIDFPQIIGDKIYCRFTIESPIATKVDWRIGGVSRPTPYGPGESTISFVNTVSSVNRYMYLFTENFTPDMVLKLDKVKAINLTEVFGAGNEPTKEEMDELIKVTGYIDGEYALNNKEMLIWTLALIRRNKNAIVALGGA